MKSILFGLSLVAVAATVSTAAQAGSFPVCISFAPAGFCDAMEFDGKKAATWHNYDCAGSQGLQTKASYSKGKTTCLGASGCNPAQAYGWDALDWKFNLSASTGTLTGITGGQKQILQQNMPVSVTAGACSVNRVKSGISSLSR